MLCAWIFTKLGSSAAIPAISRAETVIATIISMRVKPLFFRSRARRRLMAFPPFPRARRRICSGARFRRRLEPHR